MHAQVGAEILVALPTEHLRNNALGACWSRLADQLADEVPIETNRCELLEHWIRPGENPGAKLREEGSELPRSHNRNSSQPPSESDTSLVGLSASA